MTKEASPDRRDFLKTAGAAGAGAVAVVSTTDLFAAGESHEVTQFSKHVGSRFSFSLPGGESFTAKLSEATPSSSEQAPGHRKAFSLIFSLPSGRELPQETYTVTHPNFGRLEMFAVPVDGLAKETRLQAVFA